MTYERESYRGIGRDEKRLGEETALRDEVEEEPSELDPAADAFADDDLEDEGLEGLDIEDEADGDEDEEGEDGDRTRVLAEDVPASTRGRRSRERELEADRAEVAVAVGDEAEEDLDGPGVRTSGGSEIRAMSQSERRREFPSARSGGGKRRGAKAPSRSRKRPSATPARRPA